MGVREQITSRFDVVRWMGDEASVSCPHPDHHDTNPSASINISKRLWVCYSCGKGGTLENLLGERIADPEIDEVLESLTRMLTTLGEEQPVYPESWLDQFDLAGVHPYWRRRGLSEATCRLFRLGYDPESGRATYPLRAPSGAVWGVVGRATGAQLPKYKYPSHAPVSTTLYGYHLVREGVADVVLVEGALDAMAMWDVGIPAVAQLGASLSREQVNLLQRLGLRTLTLAYDMDRAGEKATRAALQEPGLTSIPIRVMTWQGAKDTMDLQAQARIDAYERAELT